MSDDEHAVARRPQIQLEHVRAFGERERVGLNGVLGSLLRGAAVR
jgi:hypothetical protein